MNPNLRELLKDTCNKEAVEGIFSCEEYTAPIKNWDELASVNAIHAAISATDETQEAKKGEKQITFLKEHAKGIILDLGCGYGRVAKYLLPQRTFSGYVGVDSSIEMLSLFRKRYLSQPEEQKTPLLLVHGNITDVPIKDTTIDTVVVSAVFLHNHKKYTKTAIAECARVLREGGVVHAVNNFPNSLSFIGLQGYLYLLFLKCIGKGDKNGPVRYFTESEIRQLFSAFHSVSITRIGFEFLPKRILILPARVNAFYRNWIANPVNKGLERILPRSIQHWFPMYYDVFAQR